MTSILLSLLLFVQTSLYSLSYQSIDGNPVSFSTCRGKKILIVNIATGSEKADQLAALQQLHSKYQHELVVIGFPSNTYGSEPRTNAEILQFCKSRYGVSFHLAAKTSVLGNMAQPVYKWIAQKSANGMMDGIAARDFQKFLINEEGKLIGVFASSISPMDSTMLEAIASH